MGKAVGIDLSSTNSVVVAAIDDGSTIKLDAVGDEHVAESTAAGQREEVAA